MFVNANLEKKSRNVLSNYFLSIMNTNLNMDPVDPDFVLLYFKLKLQFYSKYCKKKVRLKSFFTLIALEHKRYNLLRLLQFKHCYKYHKDFKENPDVIPEAYIRYLKRNLYFILDFAMISVYDFFSKLFLTLVDTFDDCQYRSRRKVQKNNRNIGFLVNNIEIVYNNIVNNIKDTHSFNYFVYSLRVFALRKTYYSQNAYKTKTFTTNPFHYNFLEFITLFENNTLQYSNSNMVDYVNYKSNELTVFDFDYNQMLKSTCSKFFNRIEYTNLKFFNTDFWFYIVNTRVNLYSKFRGYLIREVTERTIKSRITRKNKKKYEEYIDKIYLYDVEFVDKVEIIVKNYKNCSFNNNILEVKENYIDPNNFKLALFENYKYQFTIERDDYDMDFTMHPIKTRVLELFRLNLKNNI